MAEADPDKLCIMIVADSDSNRLMERLVKQGVPVTMIGSTGGFLRRGNTTLISGVENSKVDDVVQTLGEECHARSEMVPAQTLPFLVDVGIAANPVRVRAGGAIMFVLDVERFVRI